MAARRTGRDASANARPWLCGGRGLNFRSGGNRHRSWFFSSWALGFIPGSLRARAPGALATGAAEGPGQLRVPDGEVETSCRSAPLGWDKAQEWSGRQGALGSGLRGRKRWQRLGPVSRGKGKITGARGRERLRDWEEGTGDCRVGLPVSGLDTRDGWSGSGRRRLVQAPQAGAGGATEGRAEGGPGRSAVRLAPGGSAGGRWPRPSSRSRGARSFPDVSPARGASSGSWSERAGGRNSPNFRGVSTPRSSPCCAELVLLGARAATAPGPAQVERGAPRRAQSARDVGAQGPASSDFPDPREGSAPALALRLADLSAGFLPGADSKALVTQEDDRVWNPDRHHLIPGQPALAVRACLPPAPPGQCLRGWLCSGASVSSCPGMGAAPRRRAEGEEVRRLAGEYTVRTWLSWAFLRSF
ncbi:uncharacterized protein [Saccopteryx bilineata]|uniref:uncharacterized protein n=1 Tax=Saccopteryx bilineata TaxID=59482 RepID=UPI00338F8560